MTELRPLAGLSISSPAPEEDAEILELLKATFGEMRSIVEWRWRYRTGDDRSAISLIVRDDKTRQVVGHVGASPARASAWGADLLAAQIFDVMTRPGWEGRGIFVAAFQSMTALLRERGFVFLYAVPNRVSLPIFIRHFDWAKVFNTRQWKRRLSLAEPVARLGRSQALARAVDAPFRAAGALGGRFAIFENNVKRKGHDFEISSSVPEGVEEFWRRHRREEDILFSRDPGFLKWRLDQRPDRSYAYYSLRKEGAIQAMAIGWMQGEVLRLIDLRALGPDPVVARLLMAHLEGHSRRHGVHGIEIAGRHGFLLEDTLGDYESTGHNPHVFCVGLLGQSPYSRELLQPQNWSLFEIDTDAV